MHLLLNGYFIGQPTTGTGQYTRNLLWQLQELWDGEISVVMPGGPDTTRPEGFDRCRFFVAQPPFGGPLAKVWFEYSAVTKAAKETGADIIHVPYFGPPLGSPVPLVVTVHDLIQLVVPALKGGPFVRFYNQCALQGAKRADYLLVDSEHTRRDVLREIKAPPDRVQTVPLACDERFSPAALPGERERLAARYGLRGDYVLYTGGLDLRKNVTTLIKAYAHARIAAPLAIAGQARSRSRQFPDLEAAAQAAGVGDHVRFLGWVEEEDKPALYRHCLAFVFPSTYEGFGLTPLEALACGAPVLCSNATSLPEVVGDAALTFDPLDVDTLASLLRRVAADPTLRADLRDRGPQRAATFSWRATAQATIAGYHRAIEFFRAAA